MGRLTSYIILFSLGLSCVSLYSRANAQTNQQTKTIQKPRGSVAGRVTVKGKGKGGIVVGVRTGDFGPQTGPLLKATTDADGNYRITDLPSGNYQVVPVAPAFVIADINAFGRQGKGVILAEGENVADIDFSMVRGGVITGKVSTADGRPVIEEQVIVSSAEQADRPGITAQMGRGAQTDDRGIYRIFGLPAGRYKVSIGQSPDSFSSGGGPGRPIYQRVFHPDVTNPNEAQVVELGEGTEATNIDITVGESIKGFAAAGVVIDGETNQPVANLRFGLQKIVGEGATGFAGATVLSDRLGSFRFENVAPGKYSIMSLPQPNGDLRIDSVSFELVDQDVTGLALRASRGASVSGTIVLEGTNDKTVHSKLAQLRLQAYVLGETSAGSVAQSSTINPDGGFRVGGLRPGLAQFQLASQDRALQKGFVISRVEREGVASPRLEIKPGEQIAGVRIIVAYGSAIVRGTVKVENGPLPAGARIMARLGKPDEPALTLRSGDVDARGRFAIEGVPAGSYELFVYALIPASRTRQPYTKQSVTVAEGSIVEVEAVIDLEPPQPARP